MPLIKSNLPVTSAFPRLFDDFFTRDFFDWGTQNSSFTLSGALSSCPER